MYYLILSSSLIVLAMGLIVYYRLFIFGFKVEVDYTVTIQDFIKVKGLKGLHLDYVNDKLKTQPLEEYYKPKNAIAIITGRFRKFGRISSEKALAKFDKYKERPLIATEILHILAKYRFAKYPAYIVVMGSVWRCLYGVRGVAVLCGGGGRRSLVLGWFGHGWRAVCRFAAVRK